jgi:pyruvate/2-oxoglutarate dehydrogenase complex dihydrolipoamide acyltransferase (E2) component
VVKEGEAVRVDQVIAVVVDEEGDVERGREEWRRREEEKEKKREARGEHVHHTVTEEIAALKE